MSSPEATFGALRTLTFDLETASADSMFTGIVDAGKDNARPVEGDFCRIAGYKINDGPVVITTNMDDLLSEIGTADVVTGHNIMGFDGLALAWHHIPVDDRHTWWAMFAAKAHDTDPLSRQHTPPRSREHGSEDHYDLDHVALRLGVEGKITGENGLAALKRRHDGYDRIPLDDPDYRAYLAQDVQASYQVAGRLPMTTYGRREHKLLTLAGHMTLTGFPVDVPLLETRIKEGEARKQAALAELSEAYGIPLGATVLRGRKPNKTEHWIPSKAPLATRAGKDALIKALWDLGAKHYPKVDKNKITHPVTGQEIKDIAAGREGMEKIIAHYVTKLGLVDLQRLCDLVTIVTTTRTVYQTAMNNLAPDGRVHPVVSMRQASGRWSVTKPGMTVYGKHAGRHVEREIFIGLPGYVVISCDLAQVDMRAVAGHSQDRAYMDLFGWEDDGTQKDAHQLIADMLGIPRQEAKARGHGWNYGLGAKRMIREGADPQVVWAFVNGMERRFPRLCEWREEIREQGMDGEYLDNGFGRKMRCAPQSAYTVAPALMGQGTARDITCEVLLILIDRHPEYIPYLVGHAHDEFVFMVPEADAERVGEDIRAAFTWEWQNVPILCDLAGPGPSWGAISEK
jgi:DNA polymerase-1